MIGKITGRVDYVAELAVDDGRARLQGDDQLGQLLGRRCPFRGPQGGLFGGCWFGRVGGFIGNHGKSFALGSREFAYGPEGERECLDG